MRRTLMALLLGAGLVTGCGAAATATPSIAALATAVPPLTGATTEPPSPTPQASSPTPSSPRATLVPTSPVPDPMIHPSIKGSFAVAGDGREVALICWGDGSPTVILETGGTNIAEWRSEPQVAQLARRTRVCTYDRAGTGDSDPAPYRRRTADDVVADLAALLDAAAVEGPYVLVGRSFGGMVVTYYAQEKPKGVLGVVVFDSPAPSGTFTEESEPEMAWDSTGNTEHLDVVGGFENRFARKPVHIDRPLLLISPTQGESSPEDQRYWLQVSEDAKQMTPSCECYADDVLGFIDRLTR